MIKVFGSTDKSFGSNGDIVIRPLSAVVHNEMDGEFYLELSVDLRYADWIERGNIVVAPTPQGEQAFRIDNPIKTPTTIETKAWHVFFDTKNMVLSARSLSNQNASVALKNLNDHAVPQSPFSVSTEITEVNSCNFEDLSYFEALTLYQSIWGGHLYRNNFSFAYKESLGVDKGVTIEYAKNLTDITCEENWDEVCTKLLPIGSDGIKLNAITPSASIYIDADVQYDIPYARTITFEQNLNSEDYPSETAYKQALVADLRKQATDYINEHKYPQVNYSLEAFVETIVDIGDLIEVKDKRLGLDLMTEVISYDYNCLTNTYDQIEFGNFSPRLSSLVPMINSLIPMINKKVDKVDGMGLSSNDFTDFDLGKLESVEEGANKAEITIADNDVGVVNIGDLLIQWGTVTIAGSDNVIFAYEYSVAPSVIVCAGDNLAGAVSTYNVSNTGCTITGTGVVRWLAIGKA